MSYKSTSVVAFALGAILMSGKAEALRMECSAAAQTCFTDNEGKQHCADFPPVCEYVMDMWDWGAHSGQSGSVWTREWDKDQWGGGRSRTDSSLSRDVITKDQENSCDQTTDRPVAIASGNKLLFEVDFIVPPSSDILLGVSRTYDKALNRVGIFGKRWASNIERTLSFQYGENQCHGRLDSVAACTTGGAPLSKIYANRTNGYGWEFTQDVGGVWKDGAGSSIVASGSNWILTLKDGAVETFDSNGRPLTVKSDRGVGLTYAYNGSNQLSSVTHTSGRAITFNWSNSKVVAITAPNGQAYGYGYNAAGYLASVVNPGNLGTRTYHYEDSYQPGGLTGISINGVRYSRYAYLADGRAYWSGLEAGIERSTFTYGVDGSGTSYTDVANAVGQTTRYLLTTFGTGKIITGVRRPASGTCVAGARDTMYHLDGTVDYEVDALGVMTDYSYDADSRLIQKITGIGLSNETDQQQVKQYIWDSTRKSRLNQIKVFSTSTSQPLSTTTFAYYPDGDARARLVQSVTVTNHGGGGVSTLATTYNYTIHPSGIVSTMTVDGPLSGTGDAITYTYDSAGNLLTINNSLNHTTTYSNYNALGQPGKVTSPNGAVTEYTYNARGQVLTEKRTVNGVAQTIATTYDTRGRPVSVTTPDAEVVNTDYDAYDRVTSIFKSYPTDDGDPATYNESVTETRAISYNLLSQPLSVTTTYRYQGKEFDEFSGKPFSIGYVTTQHRVSYEYDAGGFLSKQKGENGQSVTYTYNANGDVVSETNALGHATVYGYDRHRRVSSITDAGGGVTLMGYNALGQPTLVRDARLNSTAYAYDGVGNLLSQTSPDTGTTTFTYNSVGQRTQMQRADLSITSFTYDTLGRLKTSTSGGQTRTLTYDSCANGKGMLCQAAKSGGTATTANFTYNPWGQLATRQDILSGNTDTTAYSYDGMHRLAGISYPSGVTAGYGYVGGHLTAITATVGGATTTVAQPSGYQAFGPPVYLSYGNGLFRHTNYDADRRVTAISVSGNPAALTQSLTYAFDTADRITDITNGVDAGNTWDFTYDNMSRLIGAQAPGSPVGNFGYDLIGNRTSRGAGGVQNTTLNYPATSSRLQSYVTSSLTRNFGYNPNGDTTSMTGTDGVANTFTYDPFGRLATHSRSGSTTIYTVNALDQRMAKSNSGSSSRYVYAGFNQMLAENTGGAWTSYIYNGSEPVAMVRGGQIYYIHTDHLGRPESVTNSAKSVVWKANNNAFSRGVTLDTFGGFNFGFLGQYWDSESSVWHNGYRDYEQTGGRYLQSDPIGLKGGVNTYAYVYGNPISYVDPLGLEGGGGYATGQYQMAQPNVSLQDIVDYSAGLGDGLLLGTGPYIRSALNIGSVNTCSCAYQAGGWTSFAGGTGRLAYAGIAKAGSVLATSGQAASAFRSGLKQCMSGGLTKDIRKPDLGKYGSDAALRAAAGRTNTGVNAYGGGVAGASGVAVAGSCGC